MGRYHFWLLYGALVLPLMLAGCAAAGGPCDIHLPTAAMRADAIKLDAQVVAATATADRATGDIAVMVTLDISSSQPISEGVPLHWPRYWIILGGDLVPAEVWTAGNHQPPALGPRLRAKTIIGAKPTQVTVQIRSTGGATLRLLQSKYGHSPGIGDHLHISFCYDDGEHFYTGTLEAEALMVGGG